MASPEKSYTREIRKRTGYLATWSPGVPLRLGDVGVMDDHVFIPQSSLSSFGIDFAIREDPSPIDFHYETKDAISYALEAAATVPGPGGSPVQAAASIKVAFSRDSATIFSCTSCLEHRIEDVLGLQEEIWGRYEAGLWREGWVVVTELMQADNATILIADNAGSEIAFAASGDVDVAQVQLGDATLGLRATSVKEVSNRWIAAHGLTPLFRAIGVQRGLLGTPGVGPLRRSPASDGRSDVAELDERFAYFDYPED